MYSMQMSPPPRPRGVPCPPSCPSAAAANKARLLLLPLGAPSAAALAPVPLLPRLPRPARARSRSRRRGRGSQYPSNECRGPPSTPDTVCCTRCGREKPMCCVLSAAEPAQRSVERTCASSRVCRARFTKNGGWHRTLPLGPPVSCTTCAAPPPPSKNVRTHAPCRCPATALPSSAAPAAR